MSLPALSPVFLLRLHGREIAPRSQRHNDAWNEARDLSFEHGAVDLLRLSAGGGCNVVASFASGMPVRAAVEAAS